MRRHLAMSLAGLSLLAACQVQVVTPDGPKKTPVKSTAKTPVTPAPSASASAPASPAALLPSASVAPPAPETPGLAVSGQVQVDAHYLIGQAGGNLIGQAGGNVIAVGGGNVISVGGGNVIAVGGGNLIGQAGGNYRALATDVAFGTVLPVQGMGVVAISLTTGQPIAPAVFTDATGNYRLNVPEGYAENFLVQAMVPGKDAQDPLLKDARLSYRLLVTPGKPETARAIDEDTALASAYVLQSFTARIRAIMVADDAEIDGLSEQIASNLGLPAALSPIIRTTLVQLNQDARDAGFTKSSPNLDEAAQAVFNAMLAYMENLYTLSTQSALTPGTGGTAEEAMVALTESMKVFRTGTAAKIATGYSFEAGILERANKVRQEKGLPLYQIKRPSDLGDFVVREYLASSEAKEPFSETSAVIATVLSDDPQLGARTNARVRDAVFAILGEVGKIMTTDARAKAAVKARLQALGAKQTP